MANPHRGEVAVTLAGAEYALRPTFAALAEIEVRAGIGLVALARRFAAAEFGLADMLAVLGPAIAAGGGAPPEPLGEAVVAAGLANLAAPVARFLAGALAGDTPREGTQGSVPGKAVAPPGAGARGPGGAGASSASA